MNTIEEYRAKYGDSPDGLVTARGVMISGETDDDCVIRIPVGMAEVAESEGDDRLLFMNSLAIIFKGLFKDGFDPRKDVKDIQIFISVDKKYLSDEWQVTVDNSSGGWYKLSQDMNPEDEITKIIPRVVPFSPEETEDEE